MAKNKHIISSRDSNQGRSSSVLECSHWLDMLGWVRPTRPSQWPPVREASGAGALGPGCRCCSLAYFCRAEPVSTLCDDPELGVGWEGHRLTHSSCHRLLLLQPSPWNQEQMLLIPECLFVAVDVAQLKL